MEVITPNSLKDALSKFKDKGDERWVDESELAEKAQEIVDEYLEDSVGLTQEDIADILGK